jgi:hypothetical protein
MSPPARAADCQEDSKMDTIVYCTKQLRRLWRIHWGGSGGPHIRVFSMKMISDC